MSDYIPNPQDPNRDPHNYDRYYEQGSGRGLTLVIGILVAIALVGGLMFFSGQPNTGNDQAQVPERPAATAPADQNRLPPAPRPTAPSPANPTTPTAPQQ